MSKPLFVFVVTPYSIEPASPFLVVAADIEKVSAIAESNGLKSFLVECVPEASVFWRLISVGSESPHR